MTDLELIRMHGGPARLARKLGYVKYGTQCALASLIGVRQPTVSEWLSGGRPVPVKRCVDIERVTDGAVTRRELRPDDWHRIWPELAQAEQRAE